MIETSFLYVFSPSVGDFDIELWPNESPQTSRIFVQNCLDDRYLGATFSISEGVVGCTRSSNTDSFPYTKLEAHTRLRFTRRGLVAMSVDVDKKSTQGNFLVTTVATPWLKQPATTIFGSIVGQTVYTLHKFSSMEHENGVPVVPVVVKRTTVVNSPFPELRRTTVAAAEAPVEAPRKAVSVKKSKESSLLSFDAGEDAIVFSKKRKDDSSTGGKQKQSRSSAAPPAVDQEELLEQEKREMREKTESKEKHVNIAEPTPREPFSSTEQRRESATQEKPTAITPTSANSITQTTSTQKPSALAALTGKYQRRGQRDKHAREEATLSKLAAFRAELHSARTQRPAAAASKEDTAKEDLPASGDKTAELAEFLNISSTDAGDWRSHVFEAPRRAQDTGLDDDDRIIVQDSRLRKEK